MTLNGTVEPVNAVSFRALSKRGARRVIQRAFVLVGRDRAVRQHLRSARLTTLWAVEDWGLEWTVGLNRGKFEFHRGKTGQPQLTFRWQTAEEFSRQMETGVVGKDAVDSGDDPALRRFIDPVWAAFRRHLRNVLANPIDEDGERLV
jgi:hypothetical protein